VRRRIHPARVGPAKPCDDEAVGTVKCCARYAFTDMAIGATYSEHLGWSWRPCGSLHPGAMEMRHAEPWGTTSAAPHIATLTLNAPDQVERGSHDDLVRQIAAALSKLRHRDQRRRVAIVCGQGRAFSRRRRRAQAPDGSAGGNSKRHGARRHKDSLRHDLCCRSVNWSP